MVEEYNHYGGVSEQIYCNAHTIEVNALTYWANVFLFSPNNWEFDGAWHLYWEVALDAPTIRRLVFEEVYGFGYGERFNPLFGELRPVTIILNTDYFSYLADGLYVTNIPCGTLKYPSW